MLSTRFPIAAAALAAAATLAVAQAASAQFVLVDDLESRIAGTGLQGQGNFTTIPEDANIRVVSTGTPNGNVVQAGPVSPFAQAFFNDNAAFAVGETSPATFFFQVQVPTTSTAVDVSYGVGAVPTSASDFNAFDAQFRITGAGLVSARNGGAFSGTLATLTPGEFFNVYLAVDTAADTYDIFLTPADAPMATVANRIADDFALRTPGTINAFLGITGNSTQATLTDNLFVDAGAVNLSNPIPEPASLAAAAAGVGLLTLRRRRA